jgi:hypothetical protein
MTTTLRPTRQALRVHMSHLATTHRAPLVPRHPHAAGALPTSFTPMARDPLTHEMPRHQSQHDEL